MARDVIVVSTKTNKKSTISTSATTWGALQGDLSSGHIEHNGMSAVIRETRNNLDLADARLPEGSFTLFLMPKKIKSGVDFNKVTDILSGIELGKDSKITSINVRLHLQSEELESDVAVHVYERESEEALVQPTATQVAAAEVIAAEPVATKAPVTPVVEPTTPPSAEVSETPATPPPTTEPEPPTTPVATPTATVFDLNQKVSDKEVETMRADAKKNGLKVSVKVGKDHPKYNAYYKKLYLEAKAATGGTQATPAPTAKVEPKAEPKQTPAPPAKVSSSKSSKDEDEDLDDLLREAKMLG